MQQRICKDQAKRISQLRKNGDQSSEPLEMTVLEPPIGGDDGRFNDDYIPEGKEDGQQIPSNVLDELTQDDQAVNPLASAPVIPAVQGEDILDKGLEHLSRRQTHPRYEGD
jgi:hypothetical protein